MTVLAIESLNAHYGAVQVLHDLSFAVKQGEIVSILGANGAGKTTILLCVSAIKRASSGKILYFGREVQNESSQRLVESGIVQVPEGRRVFAKLTVLENLELGAFVRPEANAVASGIDRAFQLFPALADRRNQLAGTLSGGEQQMLAISRALMGDPKLLLLDEPSMGIAPKLVVKIFETIENLNRQGLSILLVEQKASLALQIASHAIVLETGKIVMSGDSKVLLADSAVQRAYLGM